MDTATLKLEECIRITGSWKSAYQKVMHANALAFIQKLHERFDGRRKELLHSRTLVQSKLDKGWKPDFLEETKDIREGNWTVAPIPNDLQDRRVEITGPVERKMIINALNSDAKVFMADFEDSNSPTWCNNVEGQINLFDAVRKTISYEHPITGKQYHLGNNSATLMVRPRGLHLEEKNARINDESISGSLLDFGLYFYNNARTLLHNGSGPYFYLPKLEHYKEAQWWNDVFVFAQNELKVPQGTIKATVLIETILASYQLNEILFELKEHSAGLNCGRWDYIFSFIKRFKYQPGFIFPDRDQVTMAVPFMQAYSQLVIKTCHARNVHAIGGMAAQIPVKGDEEANKTAFEKVKLDKLREVKNGHDGTWVAHPGLIPIAQEVFDEYMPNANQIDNKRKDVQITAQELIAVPSGTITENGVRKNINVGIQYMAAWLSGNGAAAIFNLMEDAATAEISRTQLWQWLSNGITLENGTVFTKALYNQLFEEELAKLHHTDMLPKAWEPKLALAAEKFNDLITSKELKEFLTLEAYDLLD